jgi:PST family polysaccharide transporter
LKPFQSDGTFHPIATGSELRRSAVRGALVTLTGSAGNFFVGIGTVVILGRLLLPSDFGVVTMVTTFSLLLCSFGLNGFTELIMQREEITDSLASNLFWINVGVGVFLTLAFAASGHLLAHLFHVPEVEPVTLGMSLTILVSSTRYIHLGLLQRAMHFRTTATLNFFGQLVQFLVAVLLAFAGFHFWALVWGSVAQNIFLAVGAWAACRWVPSLPKRVAGTGAGMKFALNVYSHYAFWHFSRNTDNLLVGWRFGDRSLGFYKKAYDLFVLPLTQLMSPMNAVVVSTLSRVSGDREQFQRYFLRALSLLALIGMGIGADFAIVGSDIIRLMLGPGWAESGHIFRLFGPGIGVSMVYFTNGWIHLSIGRPDRWFRWGIFEFLVTAGLFLVGLHWGPPGIAVAWTASYFLLVVPALSYAGKPIGLGFSPVFATVWKFAAASVGAGVATSLILKATPYSATGVTAAGALARILVISFVFSGLYIALIIALYRGLKPIKETIGLVRDLLPARKSTAISDGPKTNASTSSDFPADRPKVVSAAE